MNQKIHIEDDSGDKNYFTIVPNYVLDNSNMWDTAVYAQMKKIAGEKGTCWTSRKNLAKKCGMSLDRLKKSIKSLTEKEWISFVGKKEVLTKGGPQEVNEYRVCNLWGKNNAFYETKGGSPDDTPLSKGGSWNEPKGGRQNRKGGSPDDLYQEPIKEEPIEEEGGTPAQEALSFFGGGEVFQTLLGEFSIKSNPAAMKREFEKFALYWTERNKNGTKQRWQQQETFEVKRRLVTWLSKVNDFSSTSSKKTNNVFFG